MELARSVKHNIDISAEATLLEYDYTGDPAKEIVVRADLGDSSGPIAGDGPYTMKIYLNDVPVSPNSQIEVDDGITQTIVISRPLPIESGDAIKITAVGRTADTSINAVITVRDVTAIREEEVVGSGPILVDHNYGGTDNLIVRNSAGLGLEGADIHLFNKTDYDAGNRSNAYVIGRARTVAEGRWARGLMLYAGDYVLVAFKIGVYSPTTYSLTVS